MGELVSSAVSGLFPEIEPRASGMLRLDAVHSMYWEESGDPAGIPVVFLHGGPGAGSTPKHRRFFDPGAYRIVVYDQRGAGRSTPLGGLRDNTTPHLVADLETLRRHLGVERWVVFGGSWGSTLAIAYAQAHPGRCLGLVLRGIFLCRKSEIEWFLYGLRGVFPEPWEKFAGFLPPEDRGVFRRGRGGAGTGADRGALFRERHFSSGEFAPRERAPAARHPGSDRAGALRHGLPARIGARAAPCVAASPIPDSPRRGTFGMGAGDSRRAGRGDRAIQA